MSGDREARLQAQARVVLVGREPTSHYFENLARHLLDRSRPVKLVNGFSVKQNHEQQLMRREKTDQIDAACRTVNSLYGFPGRFALKPLE